MKKNVNSQEALVFDIMIAKFFDMTLTFGLKQNILQILKKVYSVYTSFLKVVL